MVMILPECLGRVHNARITYFLQIHASTSFSRAECVYWVDRVSLNALAERLKFVCICVAKESNRKKMKIYRGTRPTLEQRSIVVGMLQGGMPVREVSRYYGVAPSTISCLQNWFNEAYRLHGESRVRAPPQTVRPYKGIVLTKAHA